MKKQHISLFWVDKLRNIIDHHPKDPEKALYEFEDYAINKEKQFNEYFYKAIEEDEKKFDEWIKSSLRGGGKQ